MKRFLTIIIGTAFPAWKVEKSDHPLHFHQFFQLFAFFLLKSSKCSWKIWSNCNIENIEKLAFQKILDIVFMFYLPCNVLSLERNPSDLGPDLHYIFNFLAHMIMANFNQNYQLYITFSILFVGYQNATVLTKWYFFS